MEEESKSIAVLGIGLIGSYLATLLTKSRSNTYLIARSSIKPKLEQNNGLSVTLLSGETLTVIKEDFKIFPTVSELINTGITPDYLIICVKRTAAVEVYNSIKCLDGKNTSIVLMMNGVGALAEAKQILPNTEIIPGMWPFNVVEQTPGNFKQGTAGIVCVESSKNGIILSNILNACNIPTKTNDDMEAVQYGKLILNLNNAVCALSAKPLKEEFGNFAYRKITSQCMTEALNIYQAKNITTVSPLVLPLSWVPWALHLPDWMFSYLMAKMIGADDKATSSMYEDVKAGRKTEIDFLQGTIVKLAEGTNVDVSVSKSVYEKIKALEARNQGLLEHKPDEIYKFE